MFCTITGWSGLDRFSLLATWFHRYRPAAVPLSQRIKRIEQIGDVVLVSYVAYLLLGVLTGVPLGNARKPEMLFSFFTARHCVLVFL